MMRRVLSALTATIVLFLTNPVVAQNNNVVVELYTSQGCSSCPPADNILQKLALRDDVIALALHVDYWDYIGWADTFADPKYTLRQRSYARAAGTRTIYTPQMIVGGKTHVIGNRRADVLEAIDAFRGQKSDVTLKLVRNGDRLSIAAKAAKSGTGAMLVQLVRYSPSEAVAIKRGENAGKTIEYINIVSEWRQIKKWDGSSPLDFAVNVSGSDPVVVIVQAAGQGPILAAAQLQ